MIFGALSMFPVRSVCVCCDAERMSNHRVNRVIVNLSPSFNCGRDRK